MSYLLIDLSYYTFYRIYALLTWYKHTNPESEETTDEIVNKEMFKEKIEKMFIQKIKELLKKYSIEPNKCILAKDCRRSDIWRNDHIDKYKDGRNNNIPGSIHKYIYEEIVPKVIDKLKIGIIDNERTEADDIVYIIKTLIRDKGSDKVTIIANDHDYLQLLDDNTFIYSLQNKCLNDKSVGNPEHDLLSKIIMGDKSDNIGKVFPKCGKKTLQKYLDDRELLNTMLDKNIEYREKFEQNKLIISFIMIPQDIKDQVKEKAIKFIK